MRPDFWQDDTLGHMPDALRLFYIGLWCVSDDAGWFEWKPAQLGAALYPYRSAARRTRDIVTWGEALETAGRIVRHPCGCAHIPTLTKHQKIGGNPSRQFKEKHMHHVMSDESGLVRTDKTLRGGKGEEGDVTGGVGGWEEKIVAMQRRGQAS